MQIIFRLAALALLCMPLATCTLPRGAALQSEIVGGADNPEADFSVYPVSREFLPVVAKWPHTGNFRQYTWIPHARGPASQLISAGDRMDISIWDSEENSLLTAAGQKVTELNGIIVSPSGTIFIPYLEEVRVSGMTADQARKTVQERLVGIVPSAQVLLNVTSGRRNSVDLVGGVRAPGSFPLPDRNFTVLSLLSAGGGVSEGINNPQIRLLRGSKVYGTSISSLYSDPRRDTTLRGGDKIIVDADKRYFLSLGAAGREDVIPFSKDNHTALEAISKIGGIQDSRANPKGILIMREYSSKAVRSDRPGPSKTRVIFTFDLTTADGLFSAGNFSIYPKDLVLVTESPVTSIRTIFGLLGSVFGLANAIEG